MVQRTVARPSFLPVLTLYHAVDDGMLASISAMFPILMKNGGFGLNYESIGLLTSIGLTVTVIFQLFTGRIGDIRDTRLLMTLGIMMMGITSFLLTLSWDFITLLTVVLLVRVGASFYHPIGIGWISKRYSGEALDRAMGYQSALGDTGVLVAFLTTGLIAMHWDWRAPFIMWGALNIGAAVLGLAMRYDTDTDVDRRQRAAKASVDVPLSKVSKGFRFALLPLAISGAAYTITSNFGPLLGTDKFHLAPDVAGLVVALWIGSGVITAAFYGRISKAIGRKRSLLIAFTGVIVCSLVVGLSDNIIVVAVAMAAFGSFLFTTWPGLFSMISDATGKVRQGFIFGIIFAGQIVGGASIAYFAGLAAKVYGISVPFLMISALSIFPLIILAMSDEPTRAGDQSIRSPES
jgi:MFS family permease